MNVNVNDLAILVHPVYPENQDKICTVAQRLPNVGTREGDGIWWLCLFPTKIKTDGYEEYGLLPFATIEDWRLRRIAGPGVPMGEESITEATNEPVEHAA